MEKYKFKFYVLKFSKCLTERDLSLQNMQYEKYAVKKSLIKGTYLRKIAAKMQCGSYETE